MKIIYFIRTLFISFEFLTIILGASSYLIFRDSLEQQWGFIKINKDALSYFALLPLVIIGWIIAEARSVVSPDDETAKTLNKWPMYWKLEIHFYVGIVFCILFGIPCLAIWCFSDLEDFRSMWAYSVLVSALLINAGSFYFAKVKVKNILCLAE